MMYTRRLFLSTAIALASLTVATLPARADLAVKFKAFQKNSTKSINHSAWDKLLRSEERRVGKEC